MQQKPRARRLRRKQANIVRKTLVNTTEMQVRFSDVDSMGVVWHGHYVRFFEDGRESWGKQYGITYLDVRDNQFFIPIVKMNCEHKRPLRYGDTAIIKTTYIANPAAKLMFEYEIYNAKDNSLVAIGETMQVFMDLNYELQITTPKFFEEWREKWGMG